MNRDRAVLNVMKGMMIGKHFLRVLVPAGILCGFGLTPERAVLIALLVDHAISGSEQSIGLYGVIKANLECSRQVRDALDRFGVPHAIPKEQTYSRPRPPGSDQDPPMPGAGMGLLRPN